jgi:7,8-dihydropterin-6-yl-methyl-4-(beta-D-ribofuranosyl)aminobenzene 5'-phosphate synthase
MLFYMTSRLFLTVLVDNTTLTDRYFSGEPGLSLLLETAGKKILFDTGYSGLFLANAGKMGISLRDLDYVVFSHGHLDHTGGLGALIRLLTEAEINHIPFTTPRIIAHPHCFFPRPKPPPPNIGSPVDEAEVRRRFPVTLSKTPVWITDDLVFLGEIPRKFTFETTDPGKRTIVMPDGSTAPDLLPDDSALAYRSGSGLVIITGCSHSGICTIVEYARDICEEQRIAGIIGGFHLIDPSSERLQGTGEYLHNAAPAAVYACHCTSLQAKIALSRYCPVEETGVGLRFEY